MRKIDPEIFTDEWFGTLDLHERILWMGIVVSCADDQGRLVNSPLRIRLKIFPYDSQITVEQIQASLDLFINTGKLKSYKAGLNGNCKNYLQITNWWKHQRAASWAAPSDHPAPEDWADRIRCHSSGNTIRLENWDKDGGYLEGKKPLPSDNVAPSQTRYEGEGEVEVEVEVEVESEDESVSPEERPTDDKSLIDQVLTASKRKGEICKHAGIPPKYSGWIISDHNTTPEDVLAELAYNYSKKGKVKKPGIITGINLTARPPEKAADEWYDQVKQLQVLPSSLKQKLGLDFQSDQEGLDTLLDVTTRIGEVEPHDQDEPGYVAWQKAYDVLRSESSLATQQYLECTLFHSFVGDVFKVIVIGPAKTKMRDWLESRLTTTVKQLLAGILNQAVDVQFIVQGGNA